MSATEDCDEKWTNADALDKATLFFRLLNHARSLEAQNEELKAMLRKHEWNASDFCEECDSNEWDGHSPDCALAKLIG